MADLAYSAMCDKIKIRNNTNSYKHTSNHRMSLLLSFMSTPWMIILVLRKNFFMNKIFQLYCALKDGY